MHVNREDETRLWNAKADLAVSYIQGERYGDAGAIMEEAVLQYRRWGTEAEYPFEHAKWFNHYAFVRLWQGRPREAIDMARHGVKLQADACGIDGSLTFMKRFFLGHMLYIAGKMDEALQVIRLVLDDQIKILGESSFYTLQSMAFYGLLQYQINNYDEAEYAIQAHIQRSWINFCFRKQLRACLRIAVKSDWYPTHIARIQFYLGCALRHKNSIKEADELEAVSFEFRDEMLRLFPHILKISQANQKSVFDQFVPFMCGRLTGKLVSRYRTQVT